MSFQKFEAAGHQRTVPTITVRMKGEIAFNRPAVEKYLDSEKGAFLFFDPDENKIGIMPTNAIGKGVRTIRHLPVDSEGKGGGSVITCKNYFDAYKIPLSEKRIFYEGDVTSEVIEGEGEVLVLQL